MNFQDAKWNFESRDLGENILPLDMIMPTLCKADVSSKGSQRVERSTVLGLGATCKLGLCIWQVCVSFLQSFLKYRAPHFYFLTMFSIPYKGIADKLAAELLKPLVLYPYVMANIFIVLLLFYPCKVIPKSYVVK